MMRNQKGFTLIELMIVVIILGVLAAILIPRFMGAQDRARCKAAVADITTIREGLGLYYVEYGHFPGSGSGAYEGHIKDSVRLYVSPPDTGVTFYEPAGGFYAQLYGGTDYTVDAGIKNVVGGVIHATADTIWSSPY